MVPARMADDPRADDAPPAPAPPEAPTTSPSAASPLAARLVRALGRRGVGWAIVALAAALATPSLDTGYQGDDWFVLDGLDRGLGEAFRFVDRPGVDVPAGPTAARAEARPASAHLPWWAAPDLRIAFFRPLAAATHGLDQAVAPGSPLFAHAHNVLWFAALCAAALLALRRFVEPWLAHLALVVYALDDARGPAVGWICNRNALVAGALGFLSLWAHDRARRAGWRPGRALAPLLFVASLLAGEIGVGAGALLVAHGLVYEPGRVHRRLLAAAPYALIGLAWLAAHHLGGYGTRGAEGYLDPLAHPLAFLARLAAQTPVLLGGALGVWSDFFPAVAGDMRVAYLAVDGVVVAIWALFFRPLWRRFPAVRMGLLASLLATVPLAGGPAADRYLVFVSFGVALATSLFLGQVLAPALRDARQSPRVFQHLVKPTALIVTLLWIGGGVIGLPARARSMAYFGRVFGETLALAREAPDRALVALNLPNEGLFDYLAPLCGGMGYACSPATTLTATRGALTVRRPDATSLELALAEPLFESQADRMTTTATRFAVGQRLTPPDRSFVVTIAHLSADGRPDGLRVTFPTALEAGRRFVAWTSDGPVPWMPPAVGFEITLAPIDPIALATRYLTEPPAPTAAR